MCTNTPMRIYKLKEQIKELEKRYKRGVHPADCFTIDICYGGNKETALDRVVIGGVSHDDDTSVLFYNLVLKSLKQSLKFWEDTAKSEIKELYASLENK